MNFFRYVSIIFIISSICVFAQLYNGPSTGTVSSGVMVSTNNFSDAPLNFDPPTPEQVRGYMEYEREPIYGSDEGEVSDAYSYVEDKNVNLDKGINGISSSYVLNSFESIQMTNSIPPDLHVALGPNHVMTTVNSVFAIYDRDGNLIKSISADAWCSSVVGNPGAFDPQIIYDHFAQRWFMLWDSQNAGSQTAYFIISYSDDEDPNGTWYNYALDATINGSIPSSPKDWGDYPQIGYDDLGIYITSRQFYFTGSFSGGKIRILDKSELYAANGGPITFTDLWNVRDLGNQPCDDLHPTISYDTGGNTAYFVIIPNNSGQSLTALYKISNPITTPVLSGVSLNVTYFYTAPDAQQLGGGQALDTGPTGSGIRNAPIIRDDSMYTVHHIRNSQYVSNTSIHYFVVDLNTETVVEELEFGAQGFYYIYPSIAVDKNHNVAVTYTRSGLTEYAGAYYSTKLATDSEFGPSQLMVEGQGNYVVTFGGSRNRWGDYLDAALDPVNEYNIYLYSEYAAATNTWGTWLTEIRMEPFQGNYSYVSPDPLECGDVEVNTESDVFNIVIANYGTDDLIISSIDASVGPFIRVSNHSFPVTLSTFDSLTVQIRFSPTQAGDYDENLGITCNDPAISGIQIVGHAYDMIEAASNYFYASSGPNNNGDMLTLDKTTGAGTLLGPSLFSQITGIAVNPLNNIIYGITFINGGTEIVRVNAGAGDAYKLFDIDLTQVTGIAFDTLGTMYLARQFGEIYTVDLTNQTYTFVTQSTISINCISFSPSTNQMWAGVFKAIGVGKDSVYTVDLSTGSATPIGVTGFATMTNDMTFTKENQLYGVVGTAAQEGKLIEINMSTGTGTEIGAIGFNNIVGLAYSINGPTVSVDKDGEFVPGEFSLEQNYPNPFNPSTTIKYELVDYGQVTLKVYDVLGNEMMTLVNEPKAAGSYQVEFDASALTSGVYFYQLKSGNLVQTKKMVLLK